MQTVNTYFVQIWVGFRIGYTDQKYGLEKVRRICEKFVNESDSTNHSKCVTITPTEYIYVDGCEPGAVVGFINYPRFPAEPEQILKPALILAEQLRVGLEQFRVTVVTPDKTYMLEDENS